MSLATTASPPHLDGILNPVLVRKLIRSWLMEDQPAFDIQSLSCTGKSVEAVITCKTPDAILAGVPFVNAVAQELQVQIIWFCAEGQKLGKKTALIKGVAENVLKMERLALNILARCCGIASATRRIRLALDNLGWTGILAGTRKTTPGFRLAEKYSLLVGGASQHRYDLSHMIMLKDNHVAICGSIQKAVTKVRAIQDFASKIEVECNSLADAEEAIAAGVEIVMLDNFEPKELAEVSKLLKSKNCKTLIEASGGITECKIHEFALPTIDIISMGSLVQGYSAVDFSLSISCLIRKDVD